MGNFLARNCGGHETLRLYAPAPILTRVFRLSRIGGYYLPSGTKLELHPPLYLPVFGGEDAEDFNPQRFIGGPSVARKHMAAFVPFGLGPTICVGQKTWHSFIQTKVVLAMLLQRFSFVISPTCVHAPMIYLTVHPQYGAQILLRKL
ncbi:hypothetical protein AMTR_s00059p00109030 [Amborella trichopoda]|uniref:Cytochrome P450 n=1 Tax=Amborella trichopoda TaxID=13333 RepID=U5D5Q7_AMBTC|nr:hypothetical protein AMTR_s00059p00109030 [Amborella trichopoda]